MLHIEQKVCGRELKKVKYMETVTFIFLYPPDAVVAMKKNITTVHEFVCCYFRF